MDWNLKVAPNGKWSDAFGQQSWGKVAMEPTGVEERQRQSNEII